MTSKLHFGNKGRGKLFLLLMSDNSGHYGAQAVDLGPAQGAIVEFTTAEDGLYPIVTHAFNFVGKGALGLIKSGDGNPKN